jgi:hypothetical protein
MNWGNKLLLTFIVFGAGITYLVYRSVTTNYELVEKDYYKSELSYQQVIDGTNRVNALTSPVKIQQTEDSILLQLPEEMKNKNISGNVWFYCAHNAASDKKFELNPAADATQLFSKESLRPGNYTVKISWNDDGKNYYSENSLTVL